MGTMIRNPWPISSSHAPETGIECKDYAGYAENLAAESRRLFTEDVVEIETCSLTDLGFEAESMKTFEQLDSYLEATEIIPLAEKELLDGKNKSTSRTDIFFLRQQHSRAPLETSEESVKLLLNRWKAFPEFVNILNAFTTEDGPLNLDQSSFYSEFRHAEEKEQVLETCYLLKQVEQNGRGGAMPWSLRQTGVYQQFHRTTRQGRCILIQPSKDLQRRMQEEFVENASYSNFINHWFAFQLLCLSTVSRNWLSYLKFLERHIAAIQNSIQFTKLQVEQNGDVTFLNLQSVHHHSDLLHRAVHALKSNITVLISLEQESKRMQQPDSPDGMKKSDAFHRSLASIVREQSFLQSHAELIHTRAERTSLMLRDTMALRDNDTMKRLSRLTVTEGNLMLSLTKKTIREARTVKTITLVTLVYLPASFTSTFLSMGYIHVHPHPSAHLLRITASPDLWFYLAITAPLMLFTLCGWWVWEFCSRRRDTVRRRRAREIKRGDEEDGGLGGGDGEAGVGRGEKREGWVGTGA